MSFADLREGAPLREGQSAETPSAKPGFGPAQVCSAPPFVRPPLVRVAARV